MVYSHKINGYPKPPITVVVEEEREPEFEITHEQLSLEKGSTFRSVPKTQKSVRFVICSGVS